MDRFAGERASPPRSDGSLLRQHAAASDTITMEADSAAPAPAPMTLAEAVKYQDSAAVGEFLAAGAGVDARDDIGATALMVAEEYGNPEAPPCCASTGPDRRRVLRR